MIPPGRYVPLPSPSEVAAGIRNRVKLNPDGSVDADVLLVSYGAEKKMISRPQKVEMIRDFCEREGIHLTGQVRSQLFSTPEITFGKCVYLDRDQVPEGSPKECNLIVHAVVHMDLELPSLPTKQDVYTKNHIYLDDMSSRNEVYANLVTSLVLLSREAFLTAWLRHHTIEATAKECRLRMRDLMEALPELLGIPLFVGRYPLFGSAGSGKPSQPHLGAPDWSMGGVFNESLAALARALVNADRSDAIDKELGQIGQELLSSPRHSIGLSMEVKTDTILIRAASSRQKQRRSQAMLDDDARLKIPLGYMTVLASPAKNVIQTETTRVFLARDRDIPHARVFHPGLCEIVSKSASALEERGSTTCGKLTVFAAPVNASKSKLLSMLAAREGQGYYSEVVLGRNEHGAGRGRPFNASRIPAMISPWARVVLIDNVHVAIGDIQAVCQGLSLLSGRDVYVAGLDTDIEGSPILPVGRLMCVANEVHKTDPAGVAPFAYCDSPACKSHRVAAARIAASSHTDRGAQFIDLRPLCRKCFAGGNALGVLHAIVGPPQSGKTKYMLGFAHKLLSKNKNVTIFFHPKFRHASGLVIAEVGKNAARLIPVTTFAEIRRVLEARQGDVDKEALVIDNLHAYDDWNASCAAFLNQLANEGMSVVVNGVETDQKGAPTVGFPELLCFAERVDKLSTSCALCGESAVRWRPSRLDATGWGDARDGYLPLCDEHFWRLHPPLVQAVPALADNGMF